MLETKCVKMIGGFMKKETKIWLELASEDYDSMLYMKKGKKTRGAILFAQQAVEKIIKAHIAEHKKKIPIKSHRIEKLLLEANLSLADIGSPDVTRLSKAYEWVRYSDLARSHFRSMDDVKELLIMAEKIYLWMLKKFKGN